MEKQTLRAFRGKANIPCRGKPFSRSLLGAKRTCLEEPPCVVGADDPDERAKAAQHLLRKMLAAGVSRYEPDPLTALRRAKRRRTG
jgi:hypothetical protein